MPSDTAVKASGPIGAVGRMLKRIHLPLDDPFAIVGMIIYAVFFLVAIILRGPARNPRPARNPL